MSAPARAFLALCVLGAAALLAAIVAAGLEESLAQGFAVVTGTLWGWATLADLYLGFVVIAGWMIATSRNRGAALLWAVALFFLGNPVTVAFLLWRARRVRTVAGLFRGDMT